jgi:hypothetical protein
MSLIRLWNKKSLKDQLSEFLYQYFHLYSHYINVYVYFLVKFWFGFILKKYTTVATNIHFSSQYMIKKVCLTHAHSLCAVLTGVWCLEVKHNCRSWLTKQLQPKYTLSCLIIVTLHSSDCLVDNRHFLLPHGLNLYFLRKFKPTVNEWTVQQKLFVLPDICCYEIITKTIIPPERLLQL